MFVRVSPRWLVKASQIRAVGRYKDSETVLTVQYIDGEETNFECDSKTMRDHYLAAIEAALTIRPINSIEED